MRRTLVIAILLTASAGVRLGANEHPVALEKNVDSAKCLECHDDKNKGKHVHTAVSMGCTACHEVKTEKDTTNIDFVAPKNELCFSCHEKKTADVKHGPYAQGQCLLCHDPHTADFENQLRAEGNALCQECHLDRRSTDSTVTLFKTIQMPDAEFQQIPKIGLNLTLKFGHPVGNHAVADVPDALHPGQKMSCLTCHENHAASRESLVRTAESNEGEKKSDVCDACHLANDNARMAEAQKRTDEQEAERQREQQLQKKAPVTTPQRLEKKKPTGSPGAMNFQSYDPLALSLLVVICVLPSTRRRRRP